VPPPQSKETFVAINLSSGLPSNTLHPQPSLGRVGILQEGVEGQPQGFSINSDTEHEIQRHD